MTATPVGPLVRPARIAALLVAQLATPGPAFAAGTPSPALGPLPASWQGRLPCADCPGIVQRLELLPDGRFVLDLTYLQPKGGPDQAYRERGRWRLDRPGRLRLTDANGRQYLAIRRDGSLLPLDIHGKPIDSPLIEPMHRQPRRPDTRQNPPLTP